MKSEHIVLVVFAAILILFTCLGGCAGYHYGSKNCPQIVKSDTAVTVIYKDTSLALVSNQKPLAKKQFTPKKEIVAKINTLPCDTIREIVKEHLTERIYSDTFTANEVKAVVNDTVVGEIIGRSVFLANLKPEIVRTVTNNIQEHKRIGLVIGASVGANQKLQWEVQPRIGIKLKQPVIIEYGYSVNSQMHNIGALYILHIGKRF